MNCQEFESTLHEIAREALADAGRRRDAEAHAAACRPCAARLADARALTGGLRALSSSTANIDAPPRVEADLLAAFRARAAEAASVLASERVVSAAGTQGERANVVRLEVKKWSWPKTFGAAGVAAAAAVALVLLVPSVLYRPRTAPATATVVSQQAGAANVEAPASGKIIVPPDVFEKSPKVDVLSTNVQTPPGVIPPPRVTPRGATVTDVKYGGSRGESRRTNVPALASDPPREIATGFIPLAHGGGFAAGEGAHIIRVELPREALARFGLPINAEHAGGRVKADVLIGEDGVARAIRFVR